MTSKEKDKAALERIAANIRHLRGDMSFHVLATKADTFPSSIKRIEDCEHMPGAGLLRRIADALGVSVDSLYIPTPSPRKKLSRAS
jgi:transcriptional regulator with XRE-family HTH domain